MVTSGFDETGFEEARAIARRRRNRIFLPIFVVAIMLAALIGIALYDYKAMRADALALSKGVIVNLQSRIETEVETYLRPISGIMHLSRELIADTETIKVTKASMEAFGIGMLHNTPQVNALFIGMADGDFLMVRRYQKDQQQALETKHIRRTTGDADDREIAFTRRDSDGGIVSDSVQPWDQYDPRTRPWYEGAGEKRDMYWTDVYPFFTNRTAGVTASIPLFDQREELRAVVGADVTLESISQFLGGLTIGKTGQAVIVDDQGRLIAHPKAELIREDGDGKPRLARVSDLKDPIISRAFDRYRVEGHGRRDFDLENRRYISSVSSLKHLLQQDWSILVVVPEDDFVGFVVDNVSKTLMMGLSVIGLAGLLAAVVVRQGLRTDRDAVRVLEREADLDAQGEAFGRLAGGQVHGSGVGAEAALATVTESLANAARVRRVSIWKLAADADALHCIDCFDRETEGHTEGTCLSKAEHPELFNALAQQQMLTVADVSDDPRLSSLHHSYLGPLGCHAIIAAPVMAGDVIDGWIWLEDQKRSGWSGHTESFLRAIANLLAMRASLSGDVLVDRQGRGMGQPPVDADIPDGPATVGRSGLTHQGLDTSLGRQRATAFTARLAARAESSGHPRAEVIEHLAVMSLRFTDAMALAEQMDADRAEPTVAGLLHELQSAAGRHQVGYLKFMSDQVVASVDPGEPSDLALEHIVEFALDAERICVTMLTSHNAPLAFRIGIDIGPAIGSLIGVEHRSFAYWGEAVQTAMDMADSGLPGKIQVTQAVYQRLNQRFLFQLRGHHYLEGFGEFSTYLLGDRL